MAIKSLADLCLKRTHVFFQTGANKDNLDAISSFPFESLPSHYKKEIEDIQNITAQNLTPQLATASISSKAFEIIWGNDLEEMLQMPTVNRVNILFAAVINKNFSMLHFILENGREELLNRRSKGSGKNAILKAASQVAENANSSRKELESSIQVLRLLYNHTKIDLNKIDSQRNNSIQILMSVFESNITSDDNKKILLDLIKELLDANKKIIDTNNFIDVFKFIFSLFKKVKNKQSINELFQIFFDYCKEKKFINNNSAEILLVSSLQQENIPEKIVKLLLQEASINNFKELIFILSYYKKNYEIMNLALNSSNFNPTRIIDRDYSSLSCLQYILENNDENMLKIFLQKFPKMEFPINFYSYRFPSEIIPIIESLQGNAFAETSEPFLSQLLSNNIDIAKLLISQKIKLHIPNRSHLYLAALLLHFNPEHFDEFFEFLSEIQNLDDVLNRNAMMLALKFIKIYKPANSDRNIALIEKLATRFSLPYDSINPINQFNLLLDTFAHDTTTCLHIVSKIPQQHLFDDQLLDIFSRNIDMFKIIKEKGIKFTLEFIQELFLKMPGNIFEKPELSSIFSNLGYDINQENTNGKSLLFLLIQSLEIHPGSANIIFKKIIFLLKNRVDVSFKYNDQNLLEYLLNAYKYSEQILKELLTEGSVFDVLIKNGYPIPPNIIFKSRNIIS